MKKILAVTIASATCLFMAQGAFAQSCTGFSGTISGAQGSLTGNTCQPGGSTLVKACGNTETFNGAGVAIYQVNVGTTNSYTINVNSSEFNPWIGYIKGTCAGATQCLDDVTNDATGTISTAPHTDADTAGGTYYLIVGDLGIDTPGCGAITVTWGANLPVSLQSFDVG